MARWLALWMAFDDIVRVADLKSRATRCAARASGEVKAGEDDLLKVYDHFKPGVPEFAALLPPALAASAGALGPRARAPGQAALGPAAEGRHAQRLRHARAAHAGRPQVAARARQPLSPSSSDDRPLAGGVVARHAQRDWQLGHEIALCGRLIKGYGATNERGKENLLHVLDHLAQALLDADSGRARPIAAAREAALADDAGKALDAALVRHGAPAAAGQGAADPLRAQARIACRAAGRTDPKPRTKGDPT